MKSSTYLGILVVLLGVFIITFADGEGGSGITLTAEEPVAGEPLTGYASEEGATWIRIKIFIDGKLVYDDEGTSGDEGEIDFEVPEDAEGKHLKIVVTSSTGSRKTASYEVA